jgi:hypothetical protein
MFKGVASETQMTMIYTVDDVAFIMCYGPVAMASPW